MKSTRQGSIGFISLGCAKNLVDSEIMATRLLSAGWRLARAPEQADFVIVNTCAFIQDAKKESLEAIFEACEWKKKGPCRAVLVAGCLSQRYRNELPAIMPEVDAWVGLDEVDRIEYMVRRLENGERGFAVISRSARVIIEPPLHRIVFTGAPFAYLKIAEGCNHHCRFCAIPRIRGRYRSRPIRRIVAEAESLLADGVRELNLISQDITSYGLDLGSRSDLPNLLRALGAIGGRFWIRLLYGHPAYVTDRLLAAMGNVSQVCHYLDIPIQHSHPDLLRAMGRSPVVGGLRHLLRQIRNAMPDITLRTTCLVGYPGETRNHFNHLMDFMAEARFDHLGVFVYSREEGTPAARLSSSVSRRVAERRRDQLMRLQQQIVFQKSQERVGKTAQILIEKQAASKQNAWTCRGEASLPRHSAWAEQAGDVWIGRSGAEAPEVDGETLIKMRSLTVLRPGLFMTVRYVASAGYDMKAVPEDNVSDE